jgi:hypothetical protein
MSTFDRTVITFHRGNAFDINGMDAEPFGTFTMNDLIDQELIEAVCNLIRAHVNDTHKDLCNFKLTLEEWDC